MTLPALALYFGVFCFTLIALLGGFNLIVSVVPRTKRLGGPEDQVDKPVSALIAAKGEEPLLLEVIDSVEKLRHGAPVETILLSDKERMSIPKGVKTIVTGDLTKAAALNLGLRASSNEFLLLLDADSVPDPDSLGSLLGAASSYGYAAAVGGHRVRSSGSLLGSLLAVEAAIWTAMTFSKSRRGLPVGGVGSFMVVRKSAVEAIGGWRAEALAEDHELSLLLLAGGFRTGFGSGSVTISPVGSAGSLLRQRVRWYRGLMDGTGLALGVARKLDAASSAVLVVEAVEPFALALYPLLLAVALFSPQLWLPVGGLWVVQVAAAFWAPAEGSKLRRFLAGVAMIPYGFALGVAALVAALTFLLRLDVPWFRSVKTP